MGKLPNIIQVTGLRQGAAKLSKQLQTTKEPLIISEKGRASAVMPDVEPRPARLSTALNVIF